MLGAIVGLMLAAAPQPPKITTVAPPPAPAERYGDWEVGYFGQGSTIASTVNSAGATFGTICTDEGCFAFLNPKIKCDAGHKYPALVNSPDAAFSVTLECEKIDDKYVYSTALDRGLTEAMSVGGVLGIAFPMASGQFQVSRFSLIGAARASARAAQIVRAPAPSSRQNAADNQTL